MDLSVVAFHPRGRPAVRYAHSRTGCEREFSVKILLVSYCFPPLGEVGTLRLARFCRHLHSFVIEYYGRALGNRVLRDLVQALAR
jgi:hypothetical protein